MGLIPSKIFKNQLNIEGGNMSNNLTKHYFRMVIISNIVLISALTMKTCNHYEALRILNGDS